MFKYNAGLRSFFQVRSIQRRSIRARQEEQQEINKVESEILMPDTIIMQDGTEINIICVVA